MPSGIRKYVPFRTEGSRNAAAVGRGHVFVLLECEE